MDESNVSRPYRPALQSNFSRAKVDREAQIRRSALELFAARGYGATTIDAIGARAGIRGPSVYKHVQSKHSLLASIMEETMDVLLAAQVEATKTGGSVLEQFHLAVAAHVRYHAEHAYEAFVGTREIQSLDEPHRSLILTKRRLYDLNLRSLIEQGNLEGLFHTPSPRLASYSILDMGMGVSVWFRPDGPVPEDDLVAEYVDIALRIVGYKPKRAYPRKK